MRSVLLAATLAVLLALVAGCGGGSATGDGGGATSAPEPAATEAAEPAGDDGDPGDVVVVVNDGGFEPADLTVPSGTRLVIRNEGSTAHSMISDDAADFNSELIDPGGQAEIYAIVPGTYQFHCEAHPNETGTLTIEE